MAVAAKVKSEFPSKGRLTRTLESGEHDDRRSGLGELQRPCIPTKDLHELRVHDLDDLLRRVQRTRYLGTQGSLAHGRGELPNDGKRDVGFQQCGANLADGRIDVLFR